MNSLEPKPPDPCPLASSYLPKNFSCSSLPNFGHHSSVLYAPSPWPDLSVTAMAAQVGNLRLGGDAIYGFHSLSTLFWVFQLGTRIESATFDVTLTAWGLPFNLRALFVFQCGIRFGLAIALSIGDLGSEVFEALAICWLIPLADPDLCVCQCKQCQNFSLGTLVATIWFSDVGWAQKTLANLRFLWTMVGSD
uniref:Uncharacterized protein n=1 Tax=Opuntia streptacantha TaxID=393608 RepID=A0A7C9DLM1_OPUST